MKKKIVIAVLILVISLSAAIGIARKFIDICVTESPNGDYRIVSVWVDKGAFGYSGAMYIKEKGLFSKLCKIGALPASYEWKSDKIISVEYPSPIDGNINNYDKDNYRREYNADDFFKSRSATQK